MDNLQNPVFSTVAISARTNPNDQGPQKTRAYDVLTLATCNFLSKGWEVSILGMLAFLQQKYALPLYMVGILSTVFIVCQITISFFAGKITHAIHSRNVILLSIIASAVSWMTLFLSGNITLLYFAYVFGGISSGLFEPIGNSLIAKISTPKNRGTAIGNFAACGDLGKIAVVAAATALAGWLGVNQACAVLCASALVALALAAVFIARPSNGSENEAREIPVHLADLRKNRRFCFATAAGIADSFSSASLYIFLPFLLNQKGIPLSNTLYFNVVFFVGYMSGRLALGRLADRHGGPQILMVSKIAMSALIVLLVLLNGSVAMAIVLFLLGIFTRGSSPIIRAMVADAMDERISFHNAFSAYSFASRGSSALSRPIYGVLASFASLGSVFYVMSAVSLLTIYPAQKYKNGHPTIHPVIEDTEGE